MATLTVVLALGGADASQAAVSNVYISKTADRASVTGGDPIGFTLTVTNHRSTPAQGVSVTDLLPTDAGTSWSIDSQSGSACSISTGSMNCQVGVLAPGARYSAHLTSPTTAATAGSSPVDNTASVRSLGGLGSASASIEVLGPPPIGRVPTHTVAGPTVSTPAKSCGLDGCADGYVPHYSAVVVADNGQVVDEGTVTFDPCSIDGEEEVLPCIAEVFNGLALFTGQFGRYPASLHVTAAYSGSATFAPSEGTI